MPGNHEEHAAVVGVRDHDRGVAGEKAAVEDEVHALRGLDRGGCAAASSIRRIASLKIPVGVDDDAGRDRLRAARFQIRGLDAVDGAPAFPDARDPDVVEQARAVVGRGLRERDRHARVVELPVVIHDAAEQVLLLEVRNAREIVSSRSSRREGARFRRAREQVVDLQTDAVERPLPPLVARHDEGEVAGDVRGVGVQKAPLVERLHDEREVALLEVADAAVHELRAAARGRLGEVRLLEQERPVAAATPHPRRRRARWRRRR